MAKRQINREAVARARKPAPPQTAKGSGNSKRLAREWNWLDAQVGKVVGLKLSTGENVTGVLQWVAQYTLLLNLDAGDVLVFKNAVVLIWLLPVEPVERESVDLDDLFAGACADTERELTRTERIMELRGDHE